MTVLLAIGLMAVVCRTGRAQTDLRGDAWDTWVAPMPAVAPAPRIEGLPNEQRVRILPRGSTRWQAESFVGEGGQRIITIDSGVNILIDNVAGTDTIDISTDRIVIWTTDEALSSLQESTPADLPLEFYMEGNIVFREGSRTIFAERMYYNVQARSGVILNGEMLSPMPGYNGLVRLKAEVLRQVDEFRFQGNNAGLTTSRMGYPRYWLQSSRFDFTNIPRPALDPVTGASIIDPRTGEGQVQYERFASSRGNSLFLGPVPIFYWPTITTDLNRPTYYLTSFAVNNDSVFGTQVLTEWDLYQLLGIDNPIGGTEWTASVDYLSERGWGFGTDFSYQTDRFLNCPGQAAGFIDAWGINDQGLDNLGQDRRRLPPEEEFRGRVLARHRHELPGGYQFNAEAGLISDRNFLEQYYEEEWDL
jgi:lipopolysaccharide assembly outer membrane protein LptD (OstA)